MLSPTVAFKPGQIDLFQIEGGHLLHRFNTGGSWWSEDVAELAGVGTVEFAGAPQVALLADQCMVTAEDVDGRVWYFAQGVTSDEWGVNELL